MNSQAFQNITNQIFPVVLDFLINYGWIFLVFILYNIFINYWITYQKKKFKSSLNFITLKIKIPREVETSYKVMEQVFSGLSVISSSPSRIDEITSGKVPLWISFEIAAKDSGIEFFIKTPVDFRKTIEALFYSHYPQAVIEETSDYTEEITTTLPNDYNSLWASEFTLSKDCVLPIKTYQFFEEKDEEKRLEPMAPLLEILSSLKEGEEIWLQFIIRGLTKDQAKQFQSEAKKKIDELFGKKETPKQSDLQIFFNSAVEVLNEFIASFPAALGLSGAPSNKKEEAKPTTFIMTPQVKENSEAIQRKISKVVFESVIRVVYFAPSAIFDKNGQSTAIKSYFSTFTVEGLNSFKDKGVKKPKTLIREIYKNWEADQLKELFENFKKRKIKDPTASKILEKNILSSEELATLYHFPLSTTVGAKISRVQTKTEAPPPNLPIIS